MKFQTKVFALVGATLIGLVGCSSAPSVADLDALASKIVKASFRDQGIVKTTVLDTDEHKAVAV
jgi:hypothetical protein